VAARAYERASLPLGRRVRGPLVVTEFSATTVVAPGWSALHTRAGDLVLEWRTRR
jgi:N-methylhydantoinase A/oxoprolinase/acetone carboxylase beta subunit